MDDDENCPGSARGEENPHTGNVSAHWLRRLDAGTVGTKRSGTYRR